MMATGKITKIVINGKDITQDVKNFLLLDDKSLDEHEAEIVKLDTSTIVFTWDEAEQGIQVANDKTIYVPMFKGRDA